MRNNLKKIMAFILSALMIFALLPAQPSLASTEPGISLGSATLTDGKYYYTNATVSGTGIQTILVNFSDTVTAGDAITVPTTTPAGFTVSATSSDNSYSKRINIDTSTTGTDNASAVQDYVRGIGFAVAGTTQTVSVTITTQNIEYDTFYNIDKQHYYQFITYTSGTTGTWTAAYDAAKEMMYLGRTGYLATVKDLAEDQFLYELSGGATGWLGGTTLTPGTLSGKYYESFSTSSNVDHWCWACGPEIGNTFYTAQVKSDTADSNSVSAGYYFNWGRGVEPNEANVEQCLTTLVVSTSNHYGQTESGYQGTAFSWNNIVYNRAYAADGCYYARGYFVEYGDKAIGDNKTGTVVTGYASDNGTLHNTSSSYAVTVNTYIDEALNDVSGDVELVQGSTTITAVDMVDEGYYTVGAGSITSGTYDVYVNGEDTGKDVTYSGSAVGIDVDYYTVTYSVSNAGAAADSSISMTAGGSAITSGAAVLSGKTVVITAAGAGADSYTYLWSGGGTNGGTAALTISSLSAAVNAVCTVTGTTTIDLSDATWQSATTYTCGLDLSSSSRMVTISVDSGYFTVPSLGSALTYLGGTNGTSYISTYGASKQYVSAVFSYSDAAAAETLLSAVIYTQEAADPVQTITATSSTVAPTGSDLYFEGHFYRYVSGSISWIDAILAAGGTPDTYFGGRGYIATATSQAENSILLKLTDTEGSGPDHWYDAWMGGLWQRNTGTVTSSSIIRGTNGSEISYSDLSGTTASQRQSLLLDYTMTFSDFNSNDSSTYINALADTVKYYWIDGPEAGREIANNETDFSPWHSGEPNCGDFIYIGWEGAYWDDLGAYDGETTSAGYDTLDGYIVEFSGFDGGSAAGKVASDTKTVPATYSVSLNTNGGTVNNGSITSYTYGVGASLPTDVTKNGSVFGGWYASSDLSGTAITAISTTDTENKTFYAKWTAVASSDGGSPSRTITVTETSSDLFAGNSGSILAEANMDNAFSNSVEVKVTDTGEDTSSFGFGAGTDVYPFDISLYIKGTDTKTEPASGYAVTISLPIPEDLLDVRDQLFIVHKSDDGTVMTLTSSLKQIGGVWYLVFDATEFSPYALVVSNLASYDTAAGLPYYLDGSGNKVFIGFAVNGKYLAPDGVTVLFTPNPKNFMDISTHWSKTYIDFVTEREIFVGTGTNVFSPDTGMTRAMFATVIGRLYERSYGKISISDARVFTDCNYDDYYGKYVDWAAKNSIIQGVGGGLFQPDRQVSRQEMATMLYRFAEFIQLTASTSTDATLNYSDASSIASWAEDAALYCQETGIITGRTGGSFAPGETATRAEVTAIIQRFVELAVK